MHKQPRPFFSGNNLWPSKISVCFAKSEVKNCTDRTVFLQFFSHKRLRPVEIKVLSQNFFFQS